MFVLFYVWAVGTMALFTLAFIFSYDVDVGYRQTLSVAALSIAWPAVVAAILLLLILILLLQLRDGTMRLVASRKCGSMPRQGRQKTEEAVHRGALAGNMQAGTWRRWADILRAHR